MKPFASQIRINKWQVESVQRQLAELVRLGDRLRADMVALEAEVAAEAQIAVNADLEARATYPAFLSHAKQRRETLLQSIADVDARAEAERDALREAFSELKKYELAAAAAEKRAERQRAQREQTVQDEVALTIFRRAE